MSDNCQNKDGFSKVIRGPNQLTIEKLYQKVLGLTVWLYSLAQPFVQGYEPIGISN